MWTQAPAPANCRNVATVPRRPSFEVRYRSAGPSLAPRQKARLDDEETDGRLDARDLGQWGERLEATSRGRFVPPVLSYWLIQSCGVIASHRMPPVRRTKERRTCRFVSPLPTSHSLP